MLCDAKRKDPDVLLFCFHLFKAMNTAGYLIVASQFYAMSNARTRMFSVLLSFFKAMNSQVLRCGIAILCNAKRKDPDVFQSCVNF